MHTDIAREIKRRLDNGEGPSHVAQEVASMLVDSKDKYRDDLREAACVGVYQWVRNSVRYERRGIEYEAKQATGLKAKGFKDNKDSWDRLALKYVIHGIPIRDHDYDSLFKAMEHCAAQEKHAQLQGRICRETLAMMKPGQRVRDLKPEKVEKIVERNIHSDREVVKKIAERNIRSDQEVEEVSA